MERLTKQELRGCNNMDLYSKQMDWQSIYNKLADLEDFMEENEWDSIEEMKSTLIHCEQKYFKVYKENQALKDRWQKLKEFIKDKNIMWTFFDLLEKMQELEEEE